MTHITRRLTAENRNQLGNPTLGNRVWAAFYRAGKTMCRELPGGRTTRIWRRARLLCAIELTGQLDSELADRLTAGRAGADRT